MCCSFIVGECPFPRNNLLPYLANKFAIAGSTAAMQKSWLHEQHHLHLLLGVCPSLLWQVIYCLGKQARARISAGFSGVEASGGLSFVSDFVWNEDGV